MKTPLLRSTTTNSYSLRVGIELFWIQLLTPINNLGGTRRRICSPDIRSVSALEANTCFRAPCSELGIRPRYTTALVSNFETLSVHHGFSTPNLTELSCPHVAALP